MAPVMSVSKSSGYSPRGHHIATSASFTEQRKQIGKSALIQVGLPIMGQSGHSNGCLE